MRTEEQREKNKLVPGWLGNGDVHALEALSSTIQNGTIIEIGSMHGKSAYCLGTSSPTSTIHCFDWWTGNPAVTEDGISHPNTLELFRENVSECKNIISTKVPIGGYAQWQGGPVDMVFLDAAHTNPSDWIYIEYWLPKIKPGGILCGHDYYTMEIDGIIHYPDINENIKRLEGMLGKTVTAHKWSCVWSFIV